MSNACNMKAVIILPTYNEKDNIGKIIPILEKEVFPKIKNWELAILVADDNSPDGTSEVVRDLKKEYSNIEISAGEKKGLGAAYIRGMNYAIEKMDADVVFEMDSDLQHDPLKVDEFLKKIEEGDDLVVGTRYSQGGSIPRKWPFIRKMFSVVANLFVRIVFLKFSIHDWTGGYRALKKEVFLKEKDELKKYSGYIFQISFLQKAVRDGFKIGEVPFSFGERNAGDSKIAPIGYILQVVYFVISTQVREMLFGKFGKFLLVGGFGFILNYVILVVLSQKGWDHSAANLVGAAVAVFSNYNLNNLWTFKEHRVKSIRMYFLKMLQFAATSAIGITFIQTGTIYLGDKFIGEQYYQLYFFIGTGFLLIWNFTVYSKFIWKKK